MAEESIIDKVYAGPIRRAREYAARRKRTLERRLGYGADGIVFSTTSTLAPEKPPSVIKAVKAWELYRNELDAYRRLHDFGVREVLGFSVPQLINHHDELWVIEMTAVSRPFVLDFVSAGVDRPLNEWPADVLEAQRRKARADFGTRWPRVNELVNEFRARYGIYLSDIKRGNIDFGDEEDG